MNQTSAETTTHKYEPVPIFETNVNTSRKNFIEIWKRALRKIKLRKLLKAANNLNEYSEEIIELINLNKPINHLRRPNHPTLIILPYNHWYVFWVVILLAHMIFVSTYGLFYSSFYESEDLLYELKFEIFLETILVLDIILSFNLAFFDNDNKLILNRKSISWRYLRKDCFLDIVVCFPFAFLFHFYPEFVKPQFFQYRIFIRLLKWLNLMKRLDYLYFIKIVDHFCSSHRTLIKLIYLSSTLSLSLHVVACFMFLYDKSNATPGTSMIFKSGLIDLNEGEQYLTYLYWALTTLSTIGYGDNVPLNTEETLICMAWMAAGVLVVSVTVGQFNFIFNQLLATDALVNENVLLATQFCQISRIPIPISRRLKIYIRDNKILTYKLDISKFLASIDISMRYEIAVNIYQNAITKVPFIIEKDIYFISFITFYMQLIRSEENKLIWHEFSLPDGIYFITEGQIKLFFKNQMFLVYKNGEYAGDIEYFYKINRKFDAYSGNNTEILKISSENLKIFKQIFPVYYQNLKQSTKQRKNNLVHELSQMILIRESCKLGKFVIDKQELGKIKGELNVLLFSMRSDLKTKKKLKELFEESLHTEYWIYECKDLIRNLIN